MSIIAAVVTILIWTSFIVIARARSRQFAAIGCGFLRFIGAGVVVVARGVGGSYAPTTRKEGALIHACCHAIMAGLVTLRIQNVGFGWRYGLVSVTPCWLTMGFLLHRLHMPAFVMPGSAVVYRTGGRYGYKTRMTSARALSLGLIFCGDLLVEAPAFLQAFDGRDVEG
ncbi:MAG: hypothetical protein IPH40_04715 [Polaromonas sp.]|nr:hypothetical protein [Polaromonas sp.]